MSAATDALLSRLFAEAALPALPPLLGAGELRVAGQTLSPHAAKLFNSERRYWQSKRGRAAPDKWLESRSGDLHPEVNIVALRPQLADLFDIKEVRPPRRYARIALAGACAC
jgi:hypothetical protein